jgi:hypothetical protein
MEIIAVEQAPQQTAVGTPTKGAGNTWTVCPAD